MDSMHKPPYGIPHSMRLSRIKGPLINQLWLVA
jgi:hypothetical protein